MPVRIDTLTLSVQSVHAPRPTMTLVAEGLRPGDVAADLFNDDQTIGERAKAAFFSEDLTDARRRAASQLRSLRKQLQETLGASMAEGIVFLGDTHGGATDAYENACDVRQWFKTQQGSNALVISGHGGPYREGSKAMGAFVTPPDDAPDKQQKDYWFPDNTWGALSLHDVMLRAGINLDGYDDVVFATCHGGVAEGYGKISSVPVWGTHPDGELHYSSGMVYHHETRFNYGTFPDPGDQATRRYQPGFKLSSVSRGGGGVSGSGRGGSGGLADQIFRKAIAGSGVYRSAATLRMAQAVGGAPTQAVSGYQIGTGKGVIEIGTLRILLNEAGVAPNDPGETMVFGKLFAAGADGGLAPDALEYVLERSQDGRPIPSAYRGELESLLGVDLAQVRIHTDAAAQAAASMVGAQAFTLGSDIYFGEGQWKPSTASGMALLGHELTHVAQEQGGAPTLELVRPYSQPVGIGGRVEAMAEQVRARLQIASIDDRFEVQAYENERVIQKALAGGGVGIEGADGPSYLALTAGGRLSRERFGDALDPGGGILGAARVSHPEAQSLGLASEGGRARLGGDGRVLDTDWLRGLLSRGEAADALIKLNSQDLTALLGPGMPLESSVRIQLEEALGYDLSGVRVHTGLEAARMAGAIEAQAFTVGHHVIMGDGAPRHDTPEGLGLLAHEATHVIQAGQGRLNELDTPARLDSLEAEAYGREADFVARAKAQHEATFTRPQMVMRSEPAAGRSAPTTSGALSGTEPVEPQPRLVELTPAATEFPSLRKDRRVTIDPIQEVIDLYQIQLSREEFLEDCKDRLLDLLRSEIELESERRETLAWNPYLPQA